MLTFYFSSGHECCFSLLACFQGMQIFNLVSYCSLFSSFSFFLLSILKWLKNLPATIIVAALNLLVFYLQWLYDFLCIIVAFFLLCKITELSQAFHSHFFSPILYFCLWSLYVRRWLAVMCHILALILFCCH